MSARAKNAIRGFIQLIDTMDKATAESSLAELVTIVIEQSELKSYYEKKKASGAKRG